jgi:hypothetical protein
MTGPAAAIALLIVASAAMAGCGGPHPFVAEGDAKSVQVNYYGDVATTWPLARQHCARYERAPRLNYSGDGIAAFDCVAP